MSIQNYLNEISSSIKAKNYVKFSAGEKDVVLKELITVIENGTEFQGNRALSYMKQIKNQKSK